jgi:hypothetical protein
MSLPVVDILACVFPAKIELKNQVDGLECFKDGDESFGETCKKACVVDVPANRQSIAAKQHHH